MAVVGASVMVSGGCSEYECGEGTEDRGGTCVAADDGTRDPASCGAGTHYDPTSLMCVSDVPPTQCDPETTTEIVDDSGVTLCVGTGSGPDCAITCKSPDPDKLTLCGQLYTAQDSERSWDGRWGGVCDPEAPGNAAACSVRLQFFDAAQFAADPTGAPALVPDELLVNDCGVYMAHNIALPSNGTIAVFADDLPATGADTWAPAASVLAVAAGQRVTRIRSVIASRATDALWTAVAGAPFGDTTVIEHGANLAIFSIEDNVGLFPIEGVTMTVPADDVLYFRDVDPLLFELPSTKQNTTGANGGALLLNGGFGMIGASGAELLDGAPGQTDITCQWPDEPGGVIPGVLLTSHRHARNAVTGEVCRRSNNQ